MIIRAAIFWVAAAALLQSGCTAETPRPAGLLIVNSRLIDGTGGPSSDGSVLVVNDRIAAVGEIEPVPQDSIVDADGLVLAPGFIDPHSHHDDGIFEAPGALAAVSQGITTIVTGQDGVHNFPLAEFFTQLETMPAAVNVASFAGHGTLREQVLGDDYQRAATATELTAMLGLLRTEMRAGALGLATGLEYDPGSFSTTGELIDLASEAARHGGRYISHIRSEDEYFWEAIDEIVRIGAEAQLPVQVSHIKLAMSRWWGQADRLTEKLDQARASGVDITADIYPYQAWNTSFRWLVTLFPDRDLNRREGAEHILSDLLSPEGIVIPRYLPEPAYDGMTIAEIAAIRESDPVTTLVELLQAEESLDGDGAGSQMLGIAMNEADIERIMAWPHTVICSDGELAGVHPRGFGAFTRFLGHYIRARKVLTLEEGVRRMTSLTAEHIGIRERGSIEVGHYADLVLFDPAIVSDHATIKDPHALSSGIEKVWVNGQLVYAGGKVSGQRPGRPIRRSSEGRSWQDR